MRLNKITSFSNQNIKNVVKLRDRGARDEKNLTIIEGDKEIARALDADINVKEIYLSDSVVDQQAVVDTVSNIKGNFSVYQISKEIFSKISYGNRQEGMLMVCEPRIIELSALRLTKKPLLVIVERVEKPGNLGAILRSCDGAGVDALIVSDPVIDLYNPNVIRASLGTIFNVPVVISSNDQTLEFLEEHNIKICAAVPTADALYSQVDLTVPIAITVGSEQEGLTEVWRDRADVQLRIPMNGNADSLNVSATTAVMIYEAVRQRNS